MKLVPETWLQDFQAPDATSPSIPNAVAKKAAQIWKFVRHDISLNQEGQIVYGDGTIGSAWEDMVRYVLLPKSANDGRPFDSDAFLLVLMDCQVPSAILDKRFAHLDEGSGSSTDDREMKERMHSDMSRNWKAY